MPKKIINKKISVIIPLYNQKQYVGEAIESILEQTYKHLEILVVDDGSTDNPLPVLEKYRRHITVFKQENKGPSGAKNTGIEHAAGDYIQFLDADDLLEKDKIERQLAFALENEADISYCEISRYFDDTKKIIPRNVGETADIFLHFYNLWNIFPTPVHSLLIKKEIFDRFGLLPEDLRADEDRYLFSLIAAGGVKFKYVPFTGGLYRVHGGNANFNHVRMMESKITYYKKLNAKLGDRFILDKTGFSGWQMMCANLTHVYLQALSDGVKRSILRRIKKLYKKEGITFAVGPIPSRFKKSSLPRKLLAAYLTRWGHVVAPPEAKYGHAKCLKRR